MPQSLSGLLQAFKGFGITPGSLDAQGGTPGMDFYDQPIFGMPLRRFMSTAGTLASALDPQGPGGALGRGVASIAAPYENEALRRESLTRYAQMAGRERAFEEERRGRRLRGLFQRFEPQREGFQLRERLDEPDDTRVRMSLEGVDSPARAAQPTALDVAGLYDNLSEAGARGVIEHLRNARVLPSEADATTARVLGLARDPRMQGLIPPGSLREFTAGKEGAGFKAYQPQEALQGFGPDTDVFSKSTGRRFYRTGPGTPKPEAPDMAAEGQALVYDQPSPQRDTRAWFNPSRLWSGPAQESTADTWERQRQSIIDEIQQPGLDTAARATKLRAYKLWSEKNPRPSQQSQPRGASQKIPEGGIIRDTRTGKRLIRRGNQLIPYNAK